MNRRSLIATLSALAASLPFRSTQATARCTTGNCSGNQRCCKGYTCTPTGNGNSKTCQPTGPQPVQCEVDETCPESTVCHEGSCCEVVVIGGGDTTQIVYVPITIIVPPAGRHHHRRHRRHRGH
jgi:hypothetical protein